MNKQIDDLTTADTLDGTEIMLITQGGNSRKVDLQTLADWIKTVSSIVPSSEPWRGARARRTTDLGSLSNNVALTWDSTAVDTDSFWSAGAPTHLTVPTGVTKVRLRWGLINKPEATAGTIAALLYKNGSVVANPDHYIYSAPRNSSTGFTDNTAYGFSATLDVTAGDYFEIQWFVSMSGQDTVKAGSWFEIEVVEATP